MKKLTSILSLAIILAFAFPANAQTVLLGWDFDGGATGTSQAPTTIDSSVNSTSLALGSGLPNAGGNDGGIAWGSRANTQNSFSSALGNDDFLSFTVEPSGDPVELGELRLSVSSREGEVDGTTHSFALFSDADSFASQIGNAVTTPAGTTDYTAMTIDLGGLTVSSSTEFRLATFNSSGNDFHVFRFGSTDSAFNDVQLTAVPEPASIALILGLMGGLGVILRRRR